MNAPMHAAGTAFSSREYLRLLETMGLTGNWGWAFAADMQVWSPGLYRLLGLDPTLVQPSYGLMLSLVHPEDQPAMESPAQVMQEGLLRDHTFRVIRPDGSIRILSSRAEIYFAPDGRPRGAAGMILDVTDRERLARAQASGRQNRRSLFDTFKIWTETFGAEDPLQIDPISVELSGLPLDMVQEDFTRLFAPQERNRLLEQFPAILDLGKPATLDTLTILARESPKMFRTVFVPLRDIHGQVTQWTSLSGPIQAPLAHLADSVRQGLEQSIQGFHLRAARALLDWSMMDLAQASGLSFSTVRRLEEDGEVTASRSRHTAVAALRAAGIRFSLLDGNTIAVAKV